MKANKSNIETAQSLGSQTRQNQAGKTRGATLSDLVTVMTNVDSKSERATANATGFVNAHGERVEYTFTRKAKRSKKVRRK